MELESENAGIRSTKRPTKEKCSTKRKNEMKEDILLNKAIACMEKATSVEQATNIEDDLFGQYVGAELKSIKKIQTKRYVKLKIENTNCYFEAQYEHQHNIMPYPHSMVSPHDYSTRTPSRCSYS